MGASQSGPTRDVVVSNPDASSILEISQNIVDRWKHEQSDNVSGNIEAGKPIYVTSYQLSKEIEREIDKNNASWESRLKRLQQGYGNVDKEFDKEYDKAVEEADAFLLKIALKKMEDSCAVSKKSVIQCYKKNKTQPLLCSKEVEEFNKCVSSRVELLSKG